MEESEIKKEIKKGGRGRGKHSFKKKGKSGQKQQSSNADDYFDGYYFCVGKEGPEMYVKTIEKLGLYTGTYFKNGSDVKKCLWHVDDLKISHAEKKVVDDVIKWLNDKFGKEGPLSSSSGKIL